MENKKMTNNISLGKRALLFAAVMAGAASVPAFSQTPAARQYTLTECLDEAVKNNLQLRTADRQILISQEQRKQAFTGYFPTVSATGGGFISNQGLMQMDLGAVSMSLVKNGIAAGVTAMQPLFAGGQIVNGNRLARVGEESARLQRSLTENEVRLNTETYFWQIVMLKEKLVTLDQMDRQLATVLHDAQAAVDAGVRNRNDLLQVQLRKNEVSTSRIQVENNLAVCRDLLAQMMGHTGETVEVQASVSSPEEPQQYFQPAETSLPQTTEYQLLDKQIEAGQLQYKMTVGKNLPTVAIGGGYLYNNVMDKSQNNLVGMVTVSVPLSGWWGGSHDMKRQRLQVENAVTDKQRQSELLVIRIRKAWNDFTDAYRQLDIARESITQSEENLRLNTDYYEAGTSSVSDVLDAQSLYQQSRDKYVECFTDYEVKKREYLQATGR